MQGHEMGQRGYLLDRFRQRCDRKYLMTTDVPGHDDRVTLQVGDTFGNLHRTPVRCPSRCHDQDRVTRFDHEHLLVRVLLEFLADRRYVAGLVEFRRACESGRMVRTGSEQDPAVPGPVPRCPVVRPWRGLLFRQFRVQDLEACSLHCPRIQR